MKNLLIILLLVAVIFTIIVFIPTNNVLTEDEISWIKSKKVIKFISQTEYAPFEFIDESGSSAGMCIELATWISTEFGFKAEFSDTSFSVAQEMVQNGDADVLTSFFYSTERDKIFEFSNVIWEIPAYIFVKNERPDILELKDLNGKKIGIQRKDYAFKYLEDRGINYISIDCNSFKEAAELLVRGEVDAVIGDYQIMLYNFFKTNTQNLVKTVSKPQYIGENCMAVKENQDILIRILNKGIRLASERGIFKNIDQKWTGSSIDTEVTFLQKNLSSIIITFVIVLTIVFFIAVWNFQLRMIIKRKTLLLMESNERYKTLFNNADYAVFIHDRFGKIIDVNDKMIEIYEVDSREKALGYSIDKDYSDNESNDLLSLKRIWNKVMEGETIEFDWKAKKIKSGSTFDVRVTLKPLLLNKQKIILATVKDVSNQKMMEKQLIQSQKMETIGHLSSGLAHDFNNILSGVTGALSMLKYKYKNKDFSEEVFDKYMGIIEESAYRAKKVISTLLTLAKKKEDNFEVVSISDVIKNVIEFTSNTFDKSVNVVFTNKIGKNAYINGNQAQLDQVFLNLLINAEHAVTIMRELNEKWGGTISINVDDCGMDDIKNNNLPDGNYMKISISDDGIGMDEETLNSIFTPFYSKKKTNKGSGLGLLMVYNIIEIHKGIIRVFSKPKKGSSFIIYLPKADFVEREILEKREIEAFDSSVYHCMVVDDEKNIRLLVKDFLSTLGFKHSIAATAKEALKILEENKDIDLIILDVAMPEMDGKETFIEMNKLKKDLKFLLSTGLIKDNRIEELRDLGVKHVLQKPYNINEFYEYVKKALID